MTFINPVGKTDELIAPRWEFFPHTLTRHKDDARYLALWRSARLSYARGDERGQSGWHVDRHEQQVSREADGERFARAADLLMRYQFYPIDLIMHISDFKQAQRWAQMGDHVIQRIHVVRAFGVAWADVVTMTENTAIIQEQRRVGFTYTTTEAHFELGEWQVELAWREAEELLLTMQAVSKPGPRIPWFQHPYARWLQLQAHQRGIAAFARAVSAA